MKRPDACAPVRAVDHRHAQRRIRRHAGLTVIELVLALSITGMLLTATMVALDASFRAYAAAAEEASTQAQTRMITQRLTTLVRTSTAHGPLSQNSAQRLMDSDYIELIDRKDNPLTIGYDSQKKEIWLVNGLLTQNATLPKVPLITGVAQANFTTHSRRDDDFVWVLERATMDLTVVPDQDQSLSLERGAGAAIRVIASTMPRRLN